MFGENGVKLSCTELSTIGRRGYSRPLLPHGWSDTHVRMTYPIFPRVTPTAEQLPSLSSATRADSWDAHRRVARHRQRRAIGRRSILA